TGSIAVLLIGALAVMAVMLLIVFRRSLRLLPLAIALAACGITFGVVALFGGTLTMASIAVLPILIGLAVDYAIQFQSRVAEARRSGHRRAAAPVGRRVRAWRRRDHSRCRPLALSPSCSPCGRADPRRQPAARAAYDRGDGAQEAGAAAGGWCAARRPRVGRG